MTGAARGIGRAICVELARERRLLEGIALRRLGQPSEIARAVVFFASDDAAYVTGQTISVDGGVWMLG